MIFNMIAKGSGGWSTDGIATGSEPSGDIVITSTTLVQNAFISKGRITGVSSDTLTRLDASAFAKCGGLKYARFPNVTNFWGGTSVFGNCGSLEDVYLPKMTGDITSYSFQNTKIQKIAFPSLTAKIKNYALSQMRSLLEADFNAPTSIEASAFNGDSNLIVLVLRTPETATALNNLNAFGSTPFASNGTGGTLYVPNDLISSYQSATNWSTILGYTNNQIKSIESTHTDPTAPIDLTLYYADGTLIPT